MHSFTELILLVIIIVIIFGPSTAPRLGEAIGRIIKRGRQKRSGGDGPTGGSGEDR